MRRIIFGVFALLLMGAGAAHAQARMVRLYIAPNSTVAAPDIMKNLVSQCPNTTITRLTPRNPISCCKRAVGPAAIGSAFSSAAVRQYTPLPR